MRHARLHLPSVLAGAVFLGLLLVLVGMRPTASGLTAEQERILSHMALELIPDGQGGFNRTIVFGGVNVQVVNGLGATETTNGLGNLIVGYDERDAIDAHTGSHNLVAGTRHGYTSYGGLVVGFDNGIAGAFASVSGGRLNHATGTCAAISGGSIGLAVGECASIGGGKANTAFGESATVAGGWVCDATGAVSSVVGGLFNSATGSHASVLGGEDNDAAGAGSTIGGGCGQDLADPCAHLP